MQGWQGQPGVPGARKPVHLMGQASDHQPRTGNVELPQFLPMES